MKLLPLCFLQQPMEKSKKGVNTICTHVGELEDTRFKGAVSPLYMSSSYAYEGVDVKRYPRYFNTPNQKAVIDKLCALENTESGLLFSSGMAAISTAMLSFLSSGDHVVLQKDIYGGTHHFVTAEYERFGIEYTFVSNRADEIEQAVQKNTRVIYIETPSNPLLLITDIAATAQIAKANNALSIIDNTFATPINQNPLDLGIDIVTHSGTKYLGGHSDVMGGMVVGPENDWMEDLKMLRGAAGAAPSPFDCWLLQRSLPTLPLRVRRQATSARRVADFLEQHEKVTRVHFPGLSSHPHHELARRQMSGFGGMISFQVRGGARSAMEIAARTVLFTRATSLGGVESLIEHRASIEGPDTRTPEDLLRLSIGLEDEEELVDDLAQALA